MFSMDVRDTCFQIPIHLESRCYLQFFLMGTVSQSKALSFGLSAASLLFKVSHMDLPAGYRPSAVSGRLASPCGLIPCMPVCWSTINFFNSWDLKIVFNWKKSNLEPNHRAQYLGMLVDNIRDLSDSQIAQFPRSGNNCWVTKPHWSPLFSTAGSGCVPAVYHSFDNWAIVWQHICMGRIFVSQNRGQDKVTDHDTSSSTERASIRELFLVLHVETS